MRVTRTDADRFFEHGLDIGNRVIYMGSVGGEDNGTDYLMAERMVKSLHILAATDAPIEILMNNHGGCEYAGFAIMDAIRTCPCHVTIKVYGHAMSMGSLILQAADERIMAPLSRMMIHYGTWGFCDHPKIVESWTEEGLKIREWMLGYYLKRIREKKPGFTAKKLDSMLNFDSFLTAQEAVDIGLADRVLNG